MGSLGDHARHKPGGGDKNNNNDNDNLLQVGETRRLSRGSSSGTSPQRYILAFRYILYLI